MWTKTFTHLPKNNNFQTNRRSFTHQKPTRTKKVRPPLTRASRKMQLKNKPPGAPTARGAHTPANIRWRARVFVSDTFIDFSSRRRRESSDGGVLNGQGCQTRGTWGPTRAGTRPEVFASVTSLRGVTVTMRRRTWSAFAVLRPCCVTGTWRQLMWHAWRNWFKVWRISWYYWTVGTFFLLVWGLGFVRL